MEIEGLFLEEQEKKRVIKAACSKFVGPERDKCIRILEKPTDKEWRSR